ncbi:MAG TPA: formylglycine-generating enzyme family protein [Bdellovibrionales bacterium]|nr:formylglycine-generating enzyme family protein [Bdellovibrionales bacterium]
MKHIVIAILCLFASQGAFAVSELSCSAIVLSIDETIRSLAALRLKLDIAHAEGSSSIAMTALSNEYQRRERTFVQYIEQNGIMSRDAFVEQMRQEISLLQEDLLLTEQRSQQSRERENQDRREQQNVITASTIDGTRAIFHRIDPGSFTMGSGDNRVLVDVTGPFDMMATATTQIIWRKVAELANQKLRYRIDLDPSFFKGDTNPVEHVSHADVGQWLKALNKLSKRGEPALFELIPDHKTGDVYRLPTEAEWEFVVRGRGQYNDKYHFGNDRSQLADYAWYGGGPGSGTHPVAQKMPLMIGQSEFYDMYGNVGEWVSDKYDSQNGSYYVFRSGFWFAQAVHTDSAYRNKAHVTSRESIGFRLARAVKP